ncbi:MAG: 4-alpha-glucanotransferase [Christensenellales bacterium]|jgi:4-alpha-glucanotransferase
MERSSGILMHITSLPSPFGIGTLGESAYRFADFLCSAGQRYWQVLPLGPTSLGDSPYQSFSTYAGNPYFIDLELLQEDGLLNGCEYESLHWGDDVCSVDYGKVYAHRFDVLYRAYRRGWARDAEAVGCFLRENGGWAEDYALFMAIKRHFGMESWQEWPDKGIRFRCAASLRAYRSILADDVQFFIYLQYLFYKQWAELKAYVNRLGIHIIGDIPIYVAIDSADVWSEPDAFLLDEELRPVCVAGCPPDYFSETGQLWGNPVYDWARMKDTRYDWWIRRIGGVMKLYDVVRIDHFRGFDTYYTIPYGQETAIGGEWCRGPGMDFFDELKKRLGDIPIVAEDLGDLHESVYELLHATGYPGMKVLLFAFDSCAPSIHLPHRFERNCVVYVGTHDNDTANGWFESAPADAAGYAADYLKLTRQEGYAWGMMRAAFASVADLAVLRMQDVLDLGGESRMNLPATVWDNWKWRLLPGGDSRELAQKLRGMTALYDRICHRG